MKQRYSVRETKAINGPEGTVSNKTQVLLEKGICRLHSIASIDNGFLEDIDLHISHKKVVENLNAAEYFTHEKSYCSVPHTSAEFANVNFMTPLPSEEINPGTGSATKEFAEKYHPLRQRTVREETTKDKAGALPPAVYTNKQDSTKVDLLTELGNDFNSGDQPVGLSSAK